MTLLDSSTRRCNQSPLTVHCADESGQPTISSNGITNADSTEWHQQSLDASPQATVAGVEQSGIARPPAPTEQSPRPDEASGDPVACFSTVEAAVARIAAGGAVVVVDEHDRENEGDLVFAAEMASPELVAFMMSQCRGLICVPMPGEALDRLELAQMVANNTEVMGTAFTVSVDAATGVSSGISAADRARTIRLLADPATTGADINRPGHVFPLRAREGGVLRRAGHTEAAIDLARLAGLQPAGAICEIANVDGTMARLPELIEFCARHDLPLISIADLIAYRRRTETQVERVAQTQLPLVAGQFQAIGYRGRLDGCEHLALVAGDIGDGEDVLVRVHSECLTGDVLGSLRCDCGPQLRYALGAVAAAGRGVVLYLRGQEGRGIGLLPKLATYALQDSGSDTVDANLHLGLPSDSREYGIGAQILVDLGVRTMRLLTNNPTKRAGLEGYGLEIVGREPVPVDVNRHNLRYLRTKRDRMGHDLPGLPWYDDDVDWASLAYRAAATRPDSADAHLLAMFGLGSSPSDRADPSDPSDRPDPG
jgi:3,4-dihydroxy 2-butanone 4-phosphate synthase / GTP cyclohydrolase II